MKKLSTEQIRTLAERITDADRSAFNELFRALYPQLVYFANRYTQSMAESRDIVQDVFVTLWKRREQVDPDLSLKSYLYKMTRNRALNHLRDYSSMTVPLENLHESKLRSTDASSSDDQLEKLNEQITHWINELPDRQRVAFELSRFEGLDHQEIAGVMGVSPKTVNNHIVAALKNLRNRSTRTNQNGTKRFE